MTLQQAFDFSGKTYDPERDGARLRSQLEDVRAFMADHEWHTLGEISAATGHPQASVSARLRDMRNKLGHTVERQYVERGLHRYRVVA